VKEIVATPLPGVAVPMVGAPGTVAAIVIEKFCVAVPPEFVAVTTPVNVPVAFGVPVRAPVVPFNVRPVGNAPEVRLNVGAGEPLALYVNEYGTLKLPFGGGAFTKAGPAAGVTLTVAEAALVPMAFVAFTEHEYVVPLVRPVTLIGLAAALALNGPGVHVAV
jgi:hypothetical protein